MENKTGNVFVADTIKNLEIRVETASVVVKKAVDELIRVEVENLQREENLQDIDYTCEVQDQKLIVIYRVKGKKHLINFDWKEVQVILYLPEGKTFEHIVLEIGAGELDMRGVAISCHDMVAEIGAGKLRVAHLSVTGRLDMQIGAGEAKMKETSVGILCLECGIGSCIYEGCVTKDIKVNCGVGSCKFHLNNKESEFDYDVSCALGSVRINKNSIQCLGSRKISSSNNVDRVAILKCGLGSIELDTEGETKAAVHV